MTNIIKHLESPDPDTLPDEVLPFLRWLGQPTLITVPGRDRSRSRMVVTLQHGNEPSGARAILRLLKERLQPEVTLHLLIVSVATALEEPALSHRQLPGERDMNRCFNPPFDDTPGQLANAILDTVDELKPEAIVDLHNTSGKGPAFAIATVMRREYLLLSSLFTHRVVVTDLKLGSLMEITTPTMPVITVECGGAGGLAADHYAHTGLKKFASIVDLFSEHSQEEDLDIYLHPVRLELLPEATIDCAPVPEDESDCRVDVVLPPDIEQCNFGVVDREQPLAWIRHPDCFRLKNGSGFHGIEGFFEARGNFLYPSCKLKLFMVTTNPTIAKSDCLFYAVKELDHAHLLTH